MTFRDGFVFWTWSALPDSSQACACPHTCPCSLAQCSHSVGISSANSCYQRHRRKYMQHRELMFFEYRRAKRSNG
ncbi:hypothetical protein BDU57DRAFT_515602 [Ampelomyces quisqualis]|uniref:Uncharacterized protein n=1 Tax=Ampelomyces quisqualis TaxID=50730 RepID=A0A6A5QM43_AMPQU|nr:hypothetical protein BDU57DRAFT_515602 [Ampelomyces quisqualis]